MKLRKETRSFDFDELACYNAERARGLVHTPEWQQRMEHEQRRFDMSRGRYVMDVEPQRENS